MWFCQRDIVTCHFRDELVCSREFPFGSKLRVRFLVSAPPRDDLPARLTSLRPLEKKEIRRLDYSMPTRCSGGSTSYSSFSIIHCLLKNLDPYLKPESQSTVTIVCPEACVCVCVCVCWVCVHIRRQKTPKHTHTCWPGPSILAKRTAPHTFKPAEPPTKMPYGYWD